MRAQTQLVDDLLDVSRIVSGRLRLEVQTVELAPIVEACVDAVRPWAAGKGIRLDVVLDFQAFVSGDSARLQQVVRNVLSNAIKFTPKGGRVQVRLHRTESVAELVVSDTGQGIAPDLLGHVFERLWQADGSTTRRHGGLGLGLAIARHLVELHGGSIRADSAGRRSGGDVHNPVAGGLGVGSAGASIGTSRPCRQSHPGCRACAYWWSRTNRTPGTCSSDC